MDLIPPSCTWSCSPSPPSYSPSSTQKQRIEQKLMKLGADQIQIQENPQNLNKILLLRKWPSIKKAACPISTVPFLIYNRYSVLKLNPGNFIYRLCSTNPQVTWETTVKVIIFRAEKLGLFIHSYSYKCFKGILRLHSLKLYPPKKI